MDDQRGIAPIARHAEAWIVRNYPQVNASTKRITFGPSGDSAIKVCIKGPDPDTLCALASQVGSILTVDSATGSVCNDWQNCSRVICPQYPLALGRELGMDRQDIDSVLEMNFSGSHAGLYHEGSDLLPVIVRPPKAERQDTNRLNNILV